MSKKYRVLYCSVEAHKKIKSEAGKTGKTVNKYLDDVMNVNNKDDYKNVKSKNWGKLF